MILHNNVVDVWTLEKNALEKLSYAWEDFLLQEELQRANQFYFSEDRNSFIIYHACKRIILSKYLNQEPKEISIAIQEKGKPYLPNSTVKFNLSHTKGIAALAVANNIEVGIDIEKNKKMRDYLAIAKRFFHAQEYDYLMKILDDVKRQTMFYHFWTAKESILKATGEGIIAGLDSVIITVDNKNQMYSSMNHCVLEALNTPINYISTIAALDSPISIRYQMFSSQMLL